MLIGGKQFDGITFQFLYFALLDPVNDISYIQFFCNVLLFTFSC